MKRLIVLTLSLFLLSGCGLFREGLLELSREDVKNAVAVREAATNFLSTWNFNSGFIKGALGPRLQQFPAQFIVAVDALDGLAAKANEGSISDQELGYSLGLRVRTLEALIQDTLKTFAPDVLSYIPFPLKF